MRITISAIGSRGDVQPYVALGMGLRDAGHDVRVATHRMFEPFVLEHGLGYHPFEGDPRQMLVARAVSDMAGNPLRLNRWFAQNFRPMLKEVFRATLEAAQGSDLLVNSTLSFAGYHVSEKLGVVAVGGFLQPGIPSRAFPGSTVALPPEWLPLKGLYNYWSTKLANQLFFHMLRGMTNDCRSSVLDLPPMSARDYWRVDSASYPVLVLFGYSPAVVPKPTDWGEHQQVTGYWFLSGPPDYEPPADLARFLESGPAPVYVGFGSMVDHEKEAMSRLVIEALRQAGQRAVLLGGWSELGQGALPDSILRIDHAPHDWLFPRMAAVVHHGGAGTTAAGLRAGVPTAIVPFFADQPFWGWRVWELGAGPKWIPRQKLTAAKLAAAIRQAVTDDDIRRRAAALGEVIRAEDGVGAAVEWIERHARGKPSMGSRC